MRRLLYSGLVLVVLLVRRLVGDRGGRLEVAPLFQHCARLLDALVALLFVDGVGGARAAAHERDLLGGGRQEDKRDVQIKRV